MPYEALPVAAGPSSHVCMLPHTCPTVAFAILGCEAPCGNLQTAETSASGRSSLIDKMEGLNNGDTAWMAMSCALVLFMTPGLAFFYGGLVRDSNIVNTMMMSIISMGLTTITWLIFGFTWSFDEWGAGKGFTYVGFRNLDTVWPDTTMPGHIPGSGCERV